MKHTCHAARCDVEVPEAMFMCRRHWFMVSRYDRALIWDLYEEGQEIRKDPSREYIEQTSRVIRELETREFGDQEQLFPA